MSLEARASCTTCVSETDDGDYETSSEGGLREMSTKQIKEILPTRSEEKCDKSSEEEDTPYSNVSALASSVFVKSNSMPALNTTISLDDDKQESEEIALTSDSTLAREKKLKVIIARIGPSSSNITVATEDISGIDVDNSQELKKMEPQTALPVLQNTTDVPSCKEVTFNDHLSQREPSNSVSKESSQKSFSRERGSSRQIQENDDLIDIAENPYPSVKSFYIPPTPDNARELSSSHIKQQCRITKEALRKIDGELGPLQHQLNKIRGEALLALNLMPSGSYPTTCTSGSISSYLHRDSTPLSDMSRLLANQESRDRYGSSLFPSPVANPINMSQVFYSTDTSSKNASLGNDDSYLNPQRSSSKSMNKNVSNADFSWHIHDNDSLFSEKFKRSDSSNPSGSLMPNVNNSCYRCHRNRTFDLYRPRTSPYYEIGETSSSFVGQSEIASTSSKPRYEEPMKVDKMLQAEFDSEKELKETSTSTSSPQLRVISVNTSVEERLIANLDAVQGTSKNSDSSFGKPQDQSISASLIVMGSDGNSRTRYMNYTRVDSQTSLLFKDQDAMTSFLDHRDFPEGRIKELKDLDVQCSGLNLKEIVVKRSVETLMKPSESTGSSKSSVPNDLKSIQLSKTDEKVVIVPILFTDGIPEPPKVPLFNFTRSKCHLPRANNHLVKLDKKSSSVTQNSSSGNSGNSSMMETSFINQKLMNKHSEMSSSCSRTNSSYMNPSTIKTTSDYHHHHHHHHQQHHHHHQSKRRHTHPSKAHSEPTKRATKRVIHGMRSSPEEFLCDT